MRAAIEMERLTSKEGRKLVLAAVGDADGVAGGDGDGNLEAGGAANGARGNYDGALGSSSREVDGDGLELTIRNGVNRGELRGDVEPDGMMEDVGSEGPGLESGISRHNERVELLRGKEPSSGLQVGQRQAIADDVLAYFLLESGYLSQIPTPWCSLKSQNVALAVEACCDLGVPC